ncbi:MAG TPA: hypothetical protein VMV73_02905 [Candidatus Dormibacteraeota bacterium]|nr:hypothetical protein [Candidatus Dormibacteraeota bacterium]
MKCFRYLTFVSMVAAQFVLLVAPIEARVVGEAIPQPSFCRASLESVSPVKGQPGVWRYDLSADRPGGVDANLMFKTTDSWYTVQVSNVEVRDDSGKYSRGAAMFTRAEFRSRAHFITLPAGAGEVRAGWVAAASDADSSALDSCPPMPWTEPKAAKGPAFKPWSSVIVRQNPSIFDARALPAKGVALDLATQTTVPSTPACQHFYQPVHTLVVARAYLPRKAMGFLSRRQHSAVVDVLISVGRRDNIIGATLWSPTGDRALDEEALHAAELTTYKSAEVMCQNVPGRYIISEVFAAY